MAFSEMFHRIAVTLCLAGIPIQMRKCRLFQTELDLLRYTVSRGKISPSRKHLLSSSFGRKENRPPFGFVSIFELGIKGLMTFCQDFLGTGEITQKQRRSRIEQNRKEESRREQNSSDSVVRKKIAGARREGDRFPSARVRPRQDSRTPDSGFGGLGRSMEGR